MSQAKTPTYMLSERITIGVNGLSRMHTPASLQRGFNHSMVTSRFCQISHVSDSHVGVFHIRVSYVGVSYVSVCHGRLSQGNLSHERLSHARSSVLCEVIPHVVIPQDLINQRLQHSLGHTGGYPTRGFLMRDCPTFHSRFSQRMLSERRFCHRRLSCRG